MKGKTILITGASRGLGLALAKKWQGDNKIIAVSRTTSTEFDSNVHFYSCDFGDEKELINTFQKITKDFPKIDLLINNAGVLTTAPLGIMKTENISRMIDINLKAPILISKIIFRKMMLAKSGQIINVLSMATRLCVVGDSVYSATKSGLEAFSKVLNKEGHPFGVHVNNIGITAFPSGMLDQLIGVNNEKVIELIPHKNYAPFDEIVSTIEFFEKNSTDVGGQTIYFGGV